MASSIIIFCLLWVFLLLEVQGEESNDNSWDGDGLQLTHTWDCNGMACDAETLKPWDEYRYISSPDYAPQDPSEHGGAVYGERMWLVGRASDGLSAVFADGSEERCCGSDSVGGCGQCLLIQNPEADQKKWTAVIMKKSRCPPWTLGCEPPKRRFDLSVPGFEKGSEGSFNVCGARSGTLFNSQAESELLGQWDRNFSSTADARNLARCDMLPEAFVNGCRLFSRWGWSTATPQSARYRKVKCPEKFKQWVTEKFNSDGIVTTGWYGHNLHLSHFWDCNGMGCDATTLKPFDEWRYVASPRYAPQDPELHGGSQHGEKMWLVGAASDTLARFFGAADPCCGRDDASPGCGKCLLIENPDAVQSNWSAVVMKKSRCPPHTKGCENDKVHLDIAIPGFDLLSESTANVCGQRELTRFDAMEQSGVLGDWYKRTNNTAEPLSIDRCEWLPASYRAGCRLFAAWGWKLGAPKNVKFKKVACPARFVQWVANGFDKNGVTDVAAWPTTTSTTTATSITMTTTIGMTTVTDLTTSTSITTSSSVIGTSTTNTARSTVNFLDQTYPVASATPVAAVSIVASCAGVFCFISCAIACCASRCRG